MRRFLFTAIAAALLTACAAQDEANRELAIAAASAPRDEFTIEPSAFEAGIVSVTGNWHVYAIVDPYYIMWRPRALESRQP